MIQHFLREKRFSNIDTGLSSYFFFDTQVTRQSAAIDKAEKDQKTSDAVCPDSEDAAKIHDTFSANHEGIQIHCGNCTCSI